MFGSDISVVLCTQRKIHSSW